MEYLRQEFRAPEIYGDYWFNSDPLTIGALRGYVLLIDFWNYTSFKSIQTQPYLKEWNRRYLDKGLVTIGVHTPEFPFARDAMAVRQAISELGIRYPVVMDNEYLIWGAFRNQVWPTKYLVDKHGYLRYQHAGEGSYQNFEHALQSLLAEAGYHGEFPVIMDPVRESDRAGTVSYKSTPEIVAGWQRGTIGNVEGLGAESTTLYEDPGIYIEGRLYLCGTWFGSRNYVRFESRGKEDGSIIVSYHGVDVWAVINAEGERKFQVFVEQDGSYLTALNKGSDINIDEEGRSYFLVDIPRLYHLVRDSEFGEHKLTLTTRSNGFALYSMSFGSCALQELAPRR
jgi:hypothetical protein